MTNNKQQTAVEWFAKKVMHLDWKFSNQKEKEKIIQQAKEMEKEQRSIKLPSDLLCINCDESKSSHNVCMDCIIKIGRQNIELPSDEEIEKESFDLYANHNTYSLNVRQYKAFKRGAKFVIDKIQGGKQ
jgi:ribosomal protein L32